MEESIWQCPHRSLQVLCQPLSLFLSSPPPLSFPPSFSYSFQELESKAEEVQLLQANEIILN